MKYIDLRSDTVTHPTVEMREAMYKAEVGDDVYQDDPTINKLEEYAALVVGKDAALFVPTGTFGNQLALFTHCERGNEVILGDNCHIVQHEVGASSIIAGVQLRTLSDDKNGLNPNQIEDKIRKEKDIHYPDTGLICLENALSNGRVVSLDNMKRIYAISKKYNVPIHVDGARLFNASTYLGVDVKEIAGLCDSVMFCLSKGLCAPVGSMLAGSKDFIEKARRRRKIMGGGMRQAGVLAAAGLIALEKMRLRLKEDHDNALFLADELEKIPGIYVYRDNIHINMVFFDISDTEYSSEKLVAELYEKGIRISPAENGTMRFVTHYWVDTEKILYAVDCIRQIITGAR
jgi:threonine aldolase